MPSVSSSQFQLQVAKFRSNFPLPRSPTFRSNGLQGILILHLQSESLTCIESELQKERRVCVRVCVRVCAGVKAWAFFSSFIYLVFFFNFILFPFAFFILTLRVELLRYECNVIIQCNVYPGIRFQ
jgi:hypothetical protein